MIRPFKRDSTERLTQAKRDYTELLGHKMQRVSVKKGSRRDNGDKVIFERDDGRKFVFYHDQDCCEDVYIDDVCGVLGDLVGSPLLVAEEASHRDNQATWTFYRFATQKGWVTIRWVGSSNGYYSESVDFAEIKHKNGRDVVEKIYPDSYIAMA